MRSPVSKSFPNGTTAGHLVYYKITFWAEYEILIVSLMFFQLIHRKIDDKDGQGWP